jgi:hypothetical protein
LTAVLETAGLKATERGAYGHEQGLFDEQMSRWRQPVQDA